MLLLVGRCSLSVVGCGFLLVVVRCLLLLFVDCWSLSLFVVRCSVIVLRCLLCVVVRCSLFVVRCGLSLVDLLRAVSCVLRCDCCLLFVV